MAKPYIWSSEVVFPTPVQEQIDQLLGLAANCHETGIDMRQVFICMDADGQGIFIDGSEVPHEVLPSWVMMQAEKNNSIALIMCSEGYTVSSKVAEQWAKHGRPSGQIKNHPESYEILMVQVETQLGTWTGKAALSGEHPNVTVKQPINLIKVHQASGRLNNLLQCNWKNDIPGIMRKREEALQYVEKLQQAAS